MYGYIWKLSTIRDPTLSDAMLVAIVVMAVIRMVDFGGGRSRGTLQSIVVGGQEE